jgi:hypothetical protein
MLGEGILDSCLRVFLGYGERDQGDREVGDEIMSLVEPDSSCLAFLQYTTCAEMLSPTFIHRLEILICTKCSASSFLPCMSSDYPKYLSTSLRAWFGSVVAAYRPATLRQIPYFDGM